MTLRTTLYYWTVIIPAFITNVLAGKGEPDLLNLVE